MNYSLAISKGIAYIILLLIIVSLFLYFVTVPFSSSNSEEQIKDVPIDDIVYPEYFNFSSGFERVATEDKIRNAKVLVNLHIKEMKKYDSGYLNATKNDEQYLLNWEYGDALAKYPEGESYIESRGNISTRRNRSISNFTHSVHWRFFHSYGSLPYSDPTHFKVETEMKYLLSNHSYRVVDAWAKNNITYVKYGVTENDTKSTLVMTQDGLIKSFIFKKDNTKFTYKIKTGTDSPPLLEPEWYIV